MLSRLSFVLAVAALSNCAHTTLALVDPTYRDSAVGYLCKASGCQPASSIVPGTDEKVGMVNVVLPEQCQTKFVRLVVHEAGSSDPSVEVWCAP
jgi:hypothetical protein